MKDSFSGYHPIVNFLFFALAIGFAMFVTDPICLIISAVCAVSYGIYLNGRTAFFRSLRYMIPLILMTVLINPMFNHAGVTMLGFLPGGNPLTLESIVYGFASAVLMISVLAWFSALNRIMTSDKFIYLFGRIIPSLSLILSMSLRFVPRFISETKNVAAAQKAIGRGVSDGSVFMRIKNAIRIMSVMISWSLENSIETADSMKSRGYGLKGRSAYSNYHFTKRDFNVIAALFLLGVYFLLGIIFEGITWGYFPMIILRFRGLYGISIYISYFALCILPLFISIKEERKWKSIRRKI